MGTELDSKLENPNRELKVEEGYGADYWRFIDSKLENPNRELKEATLLAVLPVLELRFKTRKSQ